jgi:hypothetical protein
MKSSTAMDSILSKKTCFVIGPIGTNGSDVRKHADWMLKGLIEPALRNLSTHEFEIWRADQITDPGSITHKVISDILSADIAIADLTGHNPNVFYELGIRHAARKPVVQIIRAGESIPFDNKDQRTIFIDIGDIDNVNESIKSLSEAILTISSTDYKTSNPVTQALGLQELAESADSRDQIIAQLTTRLEELEKIIKNHISTPPRLIRNPANASVSTFHTTPSATNTVQTSLIAEALKNFATSTGVNNSANTADIVVTRPTVSSASATQKPERPNKPRQTKT